MSNQTVRNEWNNRFGRPDPKIICVGLNYIDHAGEADMDIPERPLLFAKFSNTLCGHEDPIVLPPRIGHVDAEAELAMVIGETARNLSARNALDVIAGWTCANDVSAREAQFADGQWFRGKGYDTFCPIGPTIIPATDLDPSDLLITQRVNGSTIQQSRTSQLLFSLVDLLVFVSSVLTLDPGDLVLTGTPPGVGYFRTPPHQLVVGDVVEVEIEGIGLLRNRVEAGGVRRPVAEAKQAEWVDTRSSPIGST